MRHRLDSRAAIKRVARALHERMTTRLHLAGCIVFQIGGNSAQIDEHHMRIAAISGKNLGVVEDDEEMIACGARWHQQRRTRARLPIRHHSLAFHGRERGVDIILIPQLRHCLLRLLRGELEGIEQIFHPHRNH